MKLSHLALLAAPLLLSAACVSVANPEGYASPTFQDGTLYYFPDKGDLRAVTIGDSAEFLWDFPTDAQDDEDAIDIEAVYGDPAFDEEHVYIGSWDGDIYALERDSGSLTWSTRDRTNLTGSIVRSPTLFEGVLYAGTTEGRVYAFDATNGDALATWPEGGVKLDGEIWAQPVVAGGALFIASMDGELHKLDLETGAALWQEPFSPDRGAMPELSIASETVLFVPTLGRRVFLVDTETGEPVSADGVETKDWVWSTAAVAGETVYFGDFSGTVFAVDITTATEVWRADAGSAVKAAPAVVGETLVVADRSPAVSFFGLATGERQNRVPLAETDTVRANVIAQDGVAYILATDGKLFRADPSNLSVTPVDLPGPAN